MIELNILSWNQHGVLRNINLDLFVDISLWKNLGYPFVILMLKSNTAENKRFSVLARL